MSGRVEAAFDAVMFSDEAIDRAAEAAYRFDGGDDWAGFSEVSRERGRARVRAIIASLQGSVS